MPATPILATEDPDLRGEWQRQLPSGQLSLSLADGRLPKSLGIEVPVVMILDVNLLERMGGGLGEIPILLVGQPGSQPFEQAKIVGQALVYLSYEDSRSRLGEFLPLLTEIADRGAALKLAVERTRRPTVDSQPPFRVPVLADNLDIWDFLEGAVENLGSRERLLAEFRRASRYLLRASHAVFFLREPGGFRADRGESFCAIDDPMVTYLGRHPAVLDGVDWPGPSDPVAELAVRHRLAMWGARLLVPMHDNGRLVGMIAFGVRDDGQPFDRADHGRAVFVARLLRQFLNQSTQLSSMVEQREKMRVAERYLPQSVVLGPDETPSNQVPLAIRALIGDSRRSGQPERLFPNLEQPYRASGGPIAETGGVWAVWEEANEEVSDQTQKGKESRLDLLRNLALTVNHEVSNALVSLAALKHAHREKVPSTEMLGAAAADIEKLENLNRAIVRLSTLTEVQPSVVDMRTFLQAMGKGLGVAVEVSPEAVRLRIAEEPLRFALESIIETVIENRMDLGSEKLTLQLRSTGDGVDLTALISIKGEQLELEGVLPVPAAEDVPNQGRMGVFISREVIRMHDGEIHAGPGMQGTEILISICAWK